MTLFFLTNQFAFAESCPSREESGSFCNCLGKSQYECLTLNQGQKCQWKNNPMLETQCGGLTTETACFSDPHCNWIGNFQGNTSCIALLCEDKPGCHESHTSSSAAPNLPASLVLVAGVIGSILLNCRYY